MDPSLCEQLDWAGRTQFYSLNAEERLHHCATFGLMRGRHVSFFYFKFIVVLPSPFRAPQRHHNFLRRYMYFLHPRR